MSSATVALGVVVVVFAGGVVGLSLQHALPEKYTTGGTRDLIERVVGLLTSAHDAGARAHDLDCLGRLFQSKRRVQSFAQ
jgi:hypothetical protein